MSAEWSARGNRSPRAAEAGGRAAWSRAQGHLTRWEPRPKPGAARGWRGPRARRGPTAPWGSGRGRLRAAAALEAHRLHSSALLSGLPRPSPASQAPAMPNPAGSRKRPAHPFLSPGTASSQRFVSPPPLLSPKRRSRLQSSPLKPTWRRRRRRRPRRLQQPER